MNLLKSALPSNVGLWILIALFVMNFYAAVQVPANNSSAGELVFASAE